MKRKLLNAVFSWITCSLLVVGCSGTSSTTSATSQPVNADSQIIPPANSDTGNGGGTSDPQNPDAGGSGGGDSPQAGGPVFVPAFYNAYPFFATTQTIYFSAPTPYIFTGNCYLFAALTKNLTNPTVYNASDASQYTVTNITLTSPFFSYTAPSSPEPTTSLFVCQQGETTLMTNQIQITPQAQDSTNGGGTDQNFSYALQMYATYAKGESDAVRTDEVVSFGFPLKKGELFNVNALKITGVSAAQFRKTAQWPDGSVRWVSADFVASLGKDEVNTSHALETGGSGNTGGPDICLGNIGPISGSITANTGALIATIKPDNLNVFDEVKVGNTALIAPGNLGGVIFVDANGVEHSSRSNNATRFEILVNGPVTCRVVAEGMIGTANVGYTLYYDFFWGKPKILVTARLRNAFSFSPSHKFYNSAQLRLGTEVKGAGIKASFSDANGVASPAWDLTADQSMVVSNWYSNAHAPSFDGITGYNINTYQGYAVDLKTNSTGITTPAISRTTAAKVPLYQFLRVSQGLSKNVSVTGIRAQDFWPNGATIDASNGFLTYDIYTSTYPQKPINALRFRMYDTRRVMFDFNAGLDSITDAKISTNKVIFIPVDKKHYGEVGANSPGKFQTLTTSDLQSFYDRDDIAINKTVCTNSGSDYVNSKLIMYRAVPPGLTGGGMSNNMSANETYSTFVTGARGRYPHIEELARYRADWELYLDDKVFTNPKSPAQQAEFGIKATNSGQVSGTVDPMDSAHNWAWQTGRDFYHYTGREEFKRGLEGAFYRLRMTTYAGDVYYLRPTGMQIQGYAHLLQFFKETNDPRFAEHNQFVHDHLNGTNGISSLLYSTATPKFGYFLSPACNLDNPYTPEVYYGYCNGGFLDLPSGGGWFAPPGGSFVQSTFPPEYQSIDVAITNGWVSGEVNEGGPGCIGGHRAWMLMNRFGLGLLESYEVLKEIDPSDQVILAPLELRVIDVAREIAGKAIGRGGYRNDFANPANAIDYNVYCPFQEAYNDPNTPNYVFNYLATFAAERATTPAQRAWWHNVAVNNLQEINAHNNLSCYREFDPKIQTTIKSFLESGVTYTPAAYSYNTPFPDLVSP